MASPQDLAALAATLGNSSRPLRPRRTKTTVSRPPISPIIIDSPEAAAKKRKNAAGSPSNQEFGSTDPFSTVPEFGQSSIPEFGNSSVWEESLADGFGKMLLTESDSHRFNGMTRREFVNLMRSLKKQQLRAASTLQYLEENAEKVLFVGQEAADLAEYVRREAEMVQQLASQTTELNQAKRALSQAEEEYTKKLNDRMTEVNQANEVALSTLRSALSTAEAERDDYKGKWVNAVQSSFMNAVEQAHFLNKDFSAKGMHFLHKVEEGTLFGYLPDGSRVPVDLEDEACPDPLAVYDDDEDDDEGTPDGAH